MIDGYVINEKRLHTL